MFTVVAIARSPWARILPTSWSSIGLAQYASLVPNAAARRNPQDAGRNEIRGFDLLHEDGWLVAAGLLAAGSD
jgi:hypothetical protein